METPSQSKNATLTENWAESERHEKAGAQRVR
jgi:hypothetical protein